jgi:polar amino acid transport system permease protein
VPELTQMGRLRRSSTFRYLETFNVVAYLYLAMTLMLSAAVRFIERRFKYEE